MVRHASLFSQLVALFNRTRFSELVFRHQAERYAKGFSCWEQFVSMLFCQIAQAKSLREISGGLKSCLGKLRHLGVKVAPNKSTLSYANAHRPWQLFEDLFYQTLDWCRVAAPGKIKKFRFKNKLLSMDSSTISLCLSLFPWAKFRRTKGAVKLHLLLDHDGYLPTFACISDGKKHDVHIARVLSVAPGSIVVMDRGYNDYRLFADWTRTGVYFVTRLKDNADYIVVDRRPENCHKNILCDETIVFAAEKAQQKCPFPLRRIVAIDPVSGKSITLLTNHFEFAASTIGAIYKDRWQIALNLPVAREGECARFCGSEIASVNAPARLLSFYHGCGRRESPQGPSPGRADVFFCPGFFTTDAITDGVLVDCPGLMNS